MRRWIIPKPLRIEWACLLLGIAASGLATTPAESREPATGSHEAAADAATWPQFHGPQGAGKAPQGQLPKEWTTDDYAWSFDLGGTDVGSPVATETTVYLLDAKSGQPNAQPGEPTGTIDFVAVDLASGEELWRHSHPFVDIARHTRNTPASSTPAIADGRVFFAYADAEGASLHAYTLDGKPLWNRNLGPWSGVHGFGASPMVMGDQVIFFNSQQVDRLESWQRAGQSRMLSFDAATGAERWSTPLKSTRPCYGVPTVYHPASGEGNGHAAATPQLIAANKGNGVFGMDPTTGEILWSLSVFNKRCCSSPLIVGDLAIASCGSGGGGNYIAAVRIPQRPGELPEEAFRLTRAASYVPTPVAKDELLFTVSDNGIASCFDTAEGGRPRWSQRMGGNFGASPILIGDQLLLISLGGTAYITEAAEAKRDVSEFELGGRVGATPAFAAGRLLLRVGAKLHCLDCRSGN
ncbi:outer membrane protein assembly factor BamB family protein [Allorhodopirellula solitaria]|uniref:Outer membrane protein assembly factor BamB n=1 Tax=Allorhodopirellula solitaria TaxID=2527987 RepID=A0A5C5XXB6_9BACT|nr:PQQ-binding-like beta-propeller repeat protein [Allorhodopirellula solitaria]TWT67179.1 Outer membrane protein assembly factor BamB [Allorhodopirellula solitaria]